MSDTILSVAGLNVAYGESKVLFDVNLNVSAGQIVACVGRNGAGKTTFLKSIVGFIKPTAGTIDSAGVSLLGLSAYVVAGMGIKYIPQDKKVFSDLTVRENLELGSYASNDYNWDQVTAYFPKLKQLMDRKAGYLSGGERQMLMIGRAVLGSPKLLLVDEPTEGLAPCIVSQLRDVFLELSKKTALVIVEQNLPLVCAVADKVYALSEGRVLAEIEDREKIKPEVCVQYLFPGPKARADAVGGGQRTASAGLRNGARELRNSGRAGRRPGFMRWTSGCAMNALWWWSDLVAAFALLAALSFFVPLPFANEILIFSIYAAGCNFLLGRVGFVSFGQPAYLAVGAYGAAFYLYYFGVNPYVGVLIGLLAGLVVAVLIGPLFVRLRSDYFALVNLALAVIIFYLMQKVLAQITFGDNGLWFLTRIESTPVLDLTRPQEFFIFALLVAFGVWAFYKYLDGTIYGTCCLGLKVNEEKIRFLGYDSFNIRLFAFVIANTTTALAGAMYAVYLGFVSPEITSPARAADPIVVVILGGVGTLYGPIVGSIAYTGMKDLLSKVFGNWELIIGFLLVFIMLAGEKGIWGSLEPVLKRAFARVVARGGAAKPGATST